MKKRLIFLFLTFISLGSYADKIHIKVGAGVRPPFLFPNGKGMGPEIIKAFNLVQNEFYFELIQIPIARRISALTESWVDVIMWDNIDWGWPESLELSSSNQLLYSKDVFISSNIEAKNQSYFDNFNRKKICGVNGYHYKFLNFETNYNDIKHKVKIKLVHTEEESIKMAIKKRCDISVVSLSALNWYFNSYPEKKNNITISNRIDTEYSRSFLVPAYSPINVEDINNIFNKVKELGLLKPIYQYYGQELSSSK